MSNYYATRCHICGGYLAREKGIDLGNGRYKHASGCSLDSPKDESYLDEMYGTYRDRFTEDAPFERACDFHDGFLD